MQRKAGRVFLKALHFLLPKLVKTPFLLAKTPKGKNEQLNGKCDLTSRSSFVAPLYHQTETTGIMRTIQTLITRFRKAFNLNETKKSPQLIAINQESFCQNMAINDYYCNENNLFI